MNRKKRLILLGSTGSIGTATLDVVACHPERFQIEVLAANRNIQKLLLQAKKFRPRAIAMADPEAARVVQQAVKTWKPAVKVFSGLEGICAAARWPQGEMVVSAIVGTAGLLPTWEAIQAGKDIALANKETLVMAGELVMAEAARKKIMLLPIDSEHAALAQCLCGHPGIPIRRLILTASGGPFAKTPAALLKKVTVEQALRHPTWAMGRKITVDSATLMNKGLEIIEAHHLFQVPYEQIEVVIHPQSIVHSLVEYVDGSMLAQLASPDMRLPIQTALTAPEKITGLVKPLDFSAGLNLLFGPPDTRRFPALGFAYQAGRKAGTAPTVLNAANEIAVQAFLERRLDFIGISTVIGRVLKRHRSHLHPRLEDILKANAWARKTTEEEIACRHYR